jgi:CBS domain containing-hemolysin-like protein
LFGVEPKDEIASAHTADEFASMLAESREEGLLEDFEHALLRGALEFDERPVSEVMVPRDDVVVVLESATVRAVERLVVDRGHSRLVVVSSDLDDAVGFVHAKDLLTLSARAQDAPLPARLIRGLVVQPETRTLGEVLLAMRTARIHLALVVGADGGARGLVTLEDLLEELVGEIMDESDRA